MQVEVLPLDALHVDPANVRRHPARNLDSIKASLARFGLQKPIVIDAHNVVRAGNGTLEAARALGWETIACVRTPLRGVEAVGYSLADNRSAELAEWDDEGLAEVLRGLQSEPDFDLAAVGFADDEVDALLRRLGDETLGEEVDDPDAEWEGMPEMDNPSPAVHELHVYFRTEAAIAAFALAIGRRIDKEVRTLWLPDKPSPRLENTAWETDDSKP
jgi:hypothetical protein